MRLCSIDGCNGKHKGLGYCEKHYNRFKKYGDPLFTTYKTDCKVNGCKLKHKGHGYCRKHYEQWKFTGDPIAKRIPDKLPENCIIENCLKKPLAKGYCQMHYTRFLNHGENKDSNMGKTPEERFYSQIEKNEISGCWEWTGFVLNKANFGYGSLRVGKKTVRAHRFSYELYKGEIPEGLCICHSCDNMKCVNPEHLWAGTASDNMRDMVNKGRHGKRNSKSKLEIK